MTFEPDSPLVDDVRPAVNFGERKGCDQPDILLLHYTGMDSGQQALDWLCCEESGVSCHYFVFEDGRVLQLVPERLRAHHAGVSYWAGERDINSRSIGIEIVNQGHTVSPPPEYPDVQMQAVTTLCADIIARHPIAPHRVLAHSDVTPPRKQDPGEHFEWARLAKKGIGHWVDPAPLRSGSFFQAGDSGQPVEALQAMLALYGYEVGVSGTYDQQTEQVVCAFQRHFRPEKVDGVADISTIETLHALLKSLPESPPL